LVFVFAFAYVLTLAAALAPLLAFEEVAMRVFTLVFVNVCDSELESDAAALPVSLFAPDLAPDPDFARIFPVIVLFFLLCNVLKCMNNIVEDYCRYSLYYGDNKHKLLTNY